MGSKVSASRFNAQLRERRSGPVTCTFPSTNRELTTFCTEQCWQPLGLVSEQSERSAWRQFQPYLDKENDAAKKLPPRIGLTLAEFVEEWRTNIAVNLKGTTTRAAESHLRAHIIPKLGNYHPARDHDEGCARLRCVSGWRGTLTKDNGKRLAHPLFSS